MIEIQLTISGPWIPLIPALTSHDLGIAEAQRILNSGLTGIRVKHRSWMGNDTEHPMNNESIAFEAYRYDKPGRPGEQFAWRTSSMAAPAFAAL